MSTTNDQQGRVRLSSGPGGSMDEERVDFRHYLGAVRRSKWLILSIVFVVTSIVLAASLLLPKSYDATATVVLQEVDTRGVEPQDPESIRRRLATIQTVATGAAVLDEAAKELGGSGGDTIGSAIEVSVDPEANVIYITASSEEPAEAEETANAVANSLLRVQGELEGARLAAAREELLAQIQELEGDNSPNAEAQLQTLRDELSGLIVREALTGFELQIAELAEEPTSPASPRPARNTVLAIFASLFLGILVALLRDQFSPRISDARQIGRLTGLPVLAGIPARKGMRRRRALAAAIERGSYQTLAANLQLLRPPGDPRLILVTSAVHAEGKSTVTAHLGRALAEGGHRTLLVSVDMRWPTLHGHFRLSPRPGLSDVLELALRSGVTDHLLPAVVKSVPIPGQNSDEPSTLDVLTAGTQQEDPGRLLSSDSALAFFMGLRNYGYRYVLLDAPPMLGIADAPAVARAADDALIVAKLDRLSVENVSDLQDSVARLSVHMLGLVVIGARVEGSEYYISGRRSKIEEPVVGAR
jgi:Mrp family chromosome partitioning ATPase